MSTTALIHFPDGKRVYKKADGYPESVLRHIALTTTEDADDFVTVGNALVVGDSRVKVGESYRRAGKHEVTFIDYRYRVLSRGVGLVVPR